VREEKTSAPKIPTYPYYIPRRCGNCDRIQWWQPKPEKTRKQEQQQTTISQLRRSSILSQWSRKFLESVKGTRTLSPKQQAVVQKIENQVGGLQ
jgi:hypothetical protein